MDERATGSPALSVRRMYGGEERAVRDLAGRVFSMPESAFFSPPPHTLVAERDGYLIGAVVPKVFALPNKRWYGAIFWLMSDPQACGLGVGGRLVEAACEYFEERGCPEAFACVEGYNTSSSNLFAARGFTILSPGEQLRRYGLSGTFALWIKMFRLGADVGHYLWARPGATRPDYPGLQWWAGTLLLSVLVFLLAEWRGTLVEGLEPVMVLGAASAIVALFGLREAAMRLVAFWQGLSVRHRVWEAALPLSAAVALALGLFFPIPGSVYPRSLVWRYQDLLPKLGSIAFAGALAVLLFTWVTWGLLRLGGPSPEIALWLHFGHGAGQMLALFDVLLPFSIFVSFNGRRVWDWSRPAWAVLAAATVGLFLIRG
jgi:ribosomal protein S18 acetylase RimI-like enzyme